MKSTEQKFSGIDLRKRRNEKSPVRHETSSRRFTVSWERELILQSICYQRSHCRAHSTHTHTHTHTHTRLQKSKARHVAASNSGQFYASLPAPFSCHVDQTQALEVRCGEQRETGCPTVCETARCLCASRTSGCMCVCVRINRRSLSSTHKGAEERGGGPGRSHFSWNCNRAQSSAS